LRGRPNHRLAGHGRIDTVAIGLAQNQTTAVLGAPAIAAGAVGLRRGRLGAATSAAARGSQLDAL
jgi:hypothetical protein